ncbi:DNA topoisomerase [Lactarius indigo]|nr:DNA topoisomerase [Lactarius indigo]
MHSEEFMKKGEAHFLSDVSKSSIVENMSNWAKFRAEQQIKKTDWHKTATSKRFRASGQCLTGITKLSDANNAGTRTASQCMLILTEGDSAKALAVAGLGIVGRDYSCSYFSRMPEHMVPSGSTQDGEHEFIDLASSKKKADDRKEWLRQFTPGTYLDHNMDEISYSDFINKDHASARYIFTELAPITCTIFHLADDPLLNNLREDDNDIELYMPVIPLLLLNGKEIIDTGPTCNAVTALARLELSSRRL